MLKICPAVTAIFNFLSAQKQTFVKRPCEDHFSQVCLMNNINYHNYFITHVVSDKRIFEISANQKA